MPPRSPRRDHMRLPMRCLAVVALWGAALGVPAHSAHGAGRAAIEAPAAAADKAPLKVVVTIKPIHALAAGLMVGLGEPRLLLQGAASPHAYSLRPSDARLLNEADLVVMVSDRLETFMGKVTAALPASVKVAVMAEAPGLTRRDVREGGAFEADGHDHGHDGGHGHGDKPAADRSGADRSNAGRLDPHLWLDPDNGKAMVAHLARLLTEARPEHGARIAVNAARLNGRLDALSAEIRRDLVAIEGKPYIVFHDAYQYFEARFGVPAIGAVTINPEVPPGARRLRALRARIEAAGALCVFTEPQFEPKLARMLVLGTRARLGTLDPEGGAAVPAGEEAYFTLLRNLSTDLRACLAAAS